MMWLVIYLLVFIVQLASIVLLEFRNPAKTVAWIFILFAVPFIGILLYYFLAQDYKHRRKLRRCGTRIFQEVKDRLWRQSAVINHIEELNNKEFKGEERLFSLLTQVSESPISGCNETKVLSSGEVAFHAMLHEMDQAKDHIHIEFYIFRDDGIGSRFQQVMIRKAQEGVKVRLLCDGLGSCKLSKSFVRKLTEAGVEVCFFLPPLIATLERRLNYRNHRKIVVVDGTVGFVGGLNIGDDYLGLYDKVGYWRDSHLQLKGDAVYFLQNTFLGDWQLASEQRIVANSNLFPVHPYEGKEQVQIITSGPDQQWNAVQEICFGAVSTAKRRIWITTPYFIPDPAIYEGLKTAAVSGVEVKVIIPGQSDSRLVKLASLSYVEELLKSGVQFYEYSKGFMHAKVWIVDDLLASVGTANLDMRSFFYNFEMTALLFDQDSITRLSHDFKQDVADSHPIELQQFTERSRLQKCGELLGRLLSPLL